MSVNADFTNKKMNIIVFLLVLLSTMMHATWNFLSKKSVPSSAFFTISCAMASLCFIWAMPFGNLPDISTDSGALLLCIGSVGFETLYFLGLANAYRATDISLAYPVARALPVLLIAFITPIIHPGGVPTLPGAIGLATIFTGCLLMPLKKFSDLHWKNYFNPAIIFILMAAAGTTGYTLIDAELINYFVSSGKNRIIASAQFLFVINAGIAIALGFFTLFCRRERENFKQIVSSVKNVTPAIMAGILSSFAYIIILISMTYVDLKKLCYLQAFRQMSLPFGVLLGIFLLREPAYKPKLCGITLIVAGLIAISLSK